MKLTIFAAFAATALSTSAFAAVPPTTTVIVNDVSGLPTTTMFGTFPGENRGGGTAQVTSAAARSGNGSLEMRGDRTRTQVGIQYAPATNLGSLSNVTSLTFDWRIAADSTNPFNVDYTPALRLLVQTSAGRQELVWEGVYNGRYGDQTVADTWYTSSANDKFYLNGSGVSGQENFGKTISEWASQLTGATVSGFSVGVGSPATTGYHAFADNVTLATRDGSTTYNFEVAAAAVPEPATWAMMFVGFAMVGGAARYRSRSTKVALA